MKQNEAFAIIPHEWMTKMEQRQEVMIALLKSKSENQNSALGEYVPEAEAKKTLKRETTWFWLMRSKKKLPCLKLGRTNYYKISDLQKLLQVQDDVSDEDDAIIQQKEKEVQP